LGRDHLVTALAYVDLNPVQAHLAGHDSTGLLDLELWREIPSAMHWADALQPPPTEQDTARLRQATMAGLPLGEAEFGEDREQAFSCRLIPGRPGRKPHNAAVSA
jgi:hypothetical protein